MSDLQKKDNNVWMVSVKNELTNLIIPYTQIELDILFYLLSLIRDGVTDYSFSVGELSKISGKVWNSQELLINTRKMMNNGVVSIVTGSNYWSHFALFEKVEYKRGVITVQITKSAVPLFEHIRDNFTQLELRSALRLKNKYSKRLYWLLCQWRNLGDSKIYSIKELQRHLGIIEIDEKNNENIVIARYQRTGNFRIMIDDCCKEITSQTDLNVSPKWKKLVSQYTSVSFGVTVKDSENNVTAQVGFEPDSPEKLEFLRKLSNYKKIFNNEQIETMWNNGMRLTTWQDLMRRVTKNLAEVDDIDAYLFRCVQNEGYLDSKPIPMNIDEAIRKKNSAEYRKARLDVLSVIKNALKQGTPVEIFADMMKEYDIYPEDYKE